MKTSPIVIIGHKGKTGSRVQKRLEAMDIPTRGVSRSSTPSFDWLQPDTWANALVGAKSAFITYQPDLAIPGALEDIQHLTEVARQIGLKHLVLLSGRGEKGAQEAEKVLIQSGLSWNVVRSSWFMQNFSESFMMEGIMTGTLALPTDSILEPFVDLDDIAEVATALLTGDEYRNRVIEVTGPHAITFAECVEVIAKTTNNNIRFQKISIDEFIEELKKTGATDDIQWLMRELFTKVLDGRNVTVTTGITDVLGRPAKSFQEYVTSTTKTGVWGHSTNAQKSA